MPGAVIGAMKKTVWMSVITRAMAVPAKRSRTIACVKTRGPAAANPHTNRAVYRTPSDGASAAASAAAAYISKPPASVGLRPAASAMGP